MRTKTEEKPEAAERIPAGIENYLETILWLAGERGLCRSVDIAERLKVSKAAVHGAVRALKAMGFIEQERYGGIALSDSGKKAAAGVAARHNAVKKFLMGVLGVCEDTADADACVIEHRISRETLEKMTAYSAAEKR